jgi:hypothetical protein
VLVVVLIAVVATTLVATSRPGRQSATSGHHSDISRQVFAFGTPEDIVGWTSASKLVVLSTHSGRVVRTLATNVSILAPGIPNVSVAPDGTVFFESAEPSAENTDVDRGDQIFSVPIAGGPVRDLGSGSDPQVSPNGKSLAFIAPEPAGGVGEAPYLVPPVGIDVASLLSGSIGRVRTLEPGPAQSNQGASALSWSSDSRQLSFNLLDPSTNITTAWTLSPGVSTSLALATQIPIHRSELTWNGYWGEDKNGSNVGLGILHPKTGAQEVVTVNPSTGRVIDRLFSLRGVISSLFSSSVIGDGTGSNVLVAGVIPLVGGSPTTSGAVHLYRWRVGDGAPTKLAQQILVASWGPARHR